MRKAVLVLAGLAAIGTYFATLTAWSQSLFGTDTKKNETTSPTTAKVMSPEDFKARVNTQSQKNQESLMQDATQQLKKRAVLPGSPTQTAPAAATETPKTAAPITAPTVSEPIVGAPPANTTTMSPPPANTETSSSTSSQTPSAKQAPTTSPSVYTGFGSGQQNQNGKSKSTTSPSGSGWNINY